MNVSIYQRVLFVLTIGLLCHPLSATAESGFELAPGDVPVPHANSSAEPNTTPAQHEYFNGSHCTVVCFLGVECPLAGLYGPRLNDIAHEFADRGVRFVGINSNRQDSAAEIREWIDEHDIAFPIVKDYDNALADRYAARRTPEVVVLDPQRAIRYRGRIDDQYLPGIARPEPTRHDLRSAIEQLIAGHEVSVPATEPVGCLIGRVRTGAGSGRFTWCSDVARVLQSHCAECHRAGEIGPFALTEYDEAIGWGEMILEVIDNGRMPPWHANPEFGEFHNARHMSSKDRELLRDWVQSGCPYGDEQQHPLPKLSPVTDGWQLARSPDLVLEMRDRAFDVPSQGVVEYQYFVVDPHFKEDKWVSAAQVIPGNRATVHHAIVFIRPPDGARFRGVGWLTAYVPGQRNFALPPGHARRVPAGSKLVFQMHYTPNGEPQHDSTSVGMLFADKQAVTHEVYTLIAIDQEFEIPPHADNHQVTATVPHLPSRAELFAIMPHMHVRGKSFRLTATGTDGRQSTLLDIPQYDFNWQHSYQLVHPLPLSELRELQFAATFDNSAANPVNPDPDQVVTWGDQTFEEMAVAFFGVSEPLQGSSSKDATTAIQPITTIDKVANGERQRRIDQYVQDFMQRFDQDQDGVVERSELPIAMRSFGFRMFDSDHSDVITRDEVEASAMRRL